MILPPPPEVSSVPDRARAPAYPPSNYPPDNSRPASGPSYLEDNVALKFHSPVDLREYPGDLRDWNGRGYIFG